MSDLVVIRETFIMLSDLQWLLFAVIVGICFNVLGFVVGKLLERSVWLRLIEAGKLPRPGVEEALWIGLKEYVDKFDWSLTVSDTDYDIICITGKGMDRKK